MKPIRSTLRPGQLLVRQSGEFDPVVSHARRRPHRQTDAVHDLPYHAPWGSICRPERPHDRMEKTGDRPEVDAGGRPVTARKLPVTFVSPLPYSS